MSRRLFTLLPLCLLLFLTDSFVLQAQVSVPAPPTTTARRAPEDFIRAQRLGITFINSAQIEEQQDVDRRYQNALLLGAGWNRWPLYWNQVQTSPDTWDWSAYDALVEHDVRYNLNINAILLGVPPFYADDVRIQGLNEPIFADGSDRPGAEKQINPANHWAQFVYQAVQRYKPGGILAQRNGWTRNQGIRVWEVWNEPDHAPFWQGGILNYARLLKVAYLAAHHADDNATIMFGGLLYSTQDNWLARVLAVFQSDPFVAENNWYMDAVALHSYSYPWRTGWLTLFTRQTLIAYDLDKPIFVNESGMSVWNDYPGPVWEDGASKRGTAQQQAWFFIQSTAYAYAEGADVVFFHQLYDDCGDQAAGTDFPPHNGELCTGDAACFGDAFGLYRNTAQSICYSQHPQPGTARPAANAFRLMADIFGAHPFTGGEVTRENGITTIAFQRPSTAERIVVIWNRQLESTAAAIEAEGNAAQLHSLRGSRTVFPVDGVYNLQLNPAQPDNYPDLEDGDLTAVGGEPVILVESINPDSLRDTASAESTPVVHSEPASGAPEASNVQPTPGGILPERPSTPVGEDTTPPTTSMPPLPATSPPTFNVAWSGEDNGTIARYMVWVKINEGGWTPWLETARTEGTYTGEAGNTYQFAVWAVDSAGNWSNDTNLTPQAQTRVDAAGN